MRDGICDGNVVGIEVGGFNGFDVGWLLGIELVGEVVGVLIGIILGWE